MKGVGDSIRKCLIRSNIFADNRLTKHEAAGELLLAQGYNCKQVANILLVCNPDFLIIYIFG